jgi:hypothetical protein
MAYNINKQDGSNVTIQAGSITSITPNDQTIRLIGKNSPDYGATLNQNFFRLTESFASTTAPPTDITGHLWFDKNNTVRKLKVYDGTQYRLVGGVLVSASAPASITAGEAWLDTSRSDNPLFKVYDGSRWIQVSSTSISDSGVSGPVTGTVNVDGSTPRTVTALYSEGEVVAVISSTAFTMDGTQPSNNGNILSLGNAIRASFGTAFGVDGPVINEGITYANPTSIGSFGNLTATNLTASNIVATNGNIASLISATANITNLVTSSITASGGNITMSALNSVTGTFANIAVTNTATLNTVTYATLSNAQGEISVGNVSVTNNIFKTGVSGIGDIGSPTNTFNRVYAVASTARYADLAECYHADAVYAPGTLVRIGGQHEITEETLEVSTEVMGVVSTDPAYLMNSKNSQDPYHPAVAMIGKVPVRVVGAVTKGQRLVSAGNGCARAAKPEELNHWTVIGRALEHKYDEDESLIQAVVLINK